MATINMPAEKVIQVAQYTLDAIKEDRAKKDRELVLRTYTETNSSWWRKLTRNFLTEEQVYIKLCNNPYMDFPHNWLYKQQERHVKALLKLAQHGDPITLNEKDIQALFIDKFKNTVDKPSTRSYNHLL